MTLSSIHSLHVYDLEVASTGKSSYEIPWQRIWKVLQHISHKISLPSHSSKQLVFLLARHVVNFRIK